MSVTATQVCEIASTVWSSVLGLGTTPKPGAFAPQVRLVTACVHVSGDWEGAVVLRCTLALARRATAAMFEMPPDDATMDEVRDAIGELINIVGGNIKATLPGACRLSLPAVADGTDYVLKVSGAVPVCEAWLDCDGEPVVVAVSARAG